MFGNTTITEGDINLTPPNLVDATAMFKRAEAHNSEINITLPAATYCAYLCDTCTVKRLIINAPVAIDLRGICRVGGDATCKYVEIHAPLATNGEQMFS
jgi:hypothetical protein